MVRDSLAALRRDLAALERGGAPQAPNLFSFGLAEVDDALGGGLARGALHEVYAHSLRHAVSATGFSIALGLRAAGERPLVWVRQDFAETEIGTLSPAGLLDLGLNPSRIILVKARDAVAVLRASAEALTCPALGVVLIEPWGQPGVIDLVATRRLALAAAASGVPALMLRPAAEPLPSAATSRWSVRALRSQAPAKARANDAQSLDVPGANVPGVNVPSVDVPGMPAFAMVLLRHRAGIAGREWRVEWNRDAGCFRSRARAALSRPVGAVPVDRPVAAPAAALSPNPISSTSWRQSA